MKIAIVSETPFQLFNSINIICDFSQSAEIDLYISCYLPYMRDCANEIIKSKWFDGNIYMIEAAKGKIDRVVKYVLRGISPKYALLTSIKRNKLDFDHIVYDYIYMGCPNPISFNLANAFKNTPVIFYEEGTGSYHGKIGSSVMSKRLRLQQFLFNKGPEKIIPIRQYVYEPSLCRSEYNSEVKQLPKIKIDSLTYKKLKKIFFIDSNIKNMYLEKRVLYLGQPQYPYYKGDYLRTINLIEEELQEYSKDILFRPHPADMTYKTDFYNETSKSQWEMLAGILKEEQILIGICSSAQFTPKYIFDKEPILIFTLLIFEDYCPLNIKMEFINMIEDIKSVYSNKEKIICPKNIEELRMDLERLL